MSCISKEEKAKLVKEFGKDEKDSGSVAVQIAILSAEIDRLNLHFESHPHDFHSHRGLLQKIGHRRNLLAYLKENDINTYREVLQKLNLRK